MTPARWRDAPLWLKSLAFGVLPAAILLISTAIGYRLHLRVDAADAELSRTVAVQNDIQAIHILLAEASLGVRGYALTGRRDFLAPYDRARKSIAVILMRMRGRIHDPVVLGMHASIVQLFDRKFADLDQFRQAVDKGTDGRDLVPSLIASKAVFDELRNQLGAMHAREATLVTGFSRTARAATEQSYRFNLITSVLILVGSATAVILLLGGLLRRIGVLASNAERLVTDQRLQSVAASRDELGVLAERLQNASMLLASRAAEARAANDAKSRFLSRTSHELRTPLNAIIGHSQLLERQGNDDQARRSAEQIERAARHLLQLIDDILDLSTLETGELRVVEEAVEVGVVVEEALALISPIAEAHGVSVTCISGSVPSTLGGDRKRLRQVLLNLLSNAIKFNRRGGAVQIGWRDAAETVVIDITDTGVGIADGDVARLFEPLERLDADQRGIPGSGLGLALSRQLIMAMGGRIAVSSRAGEGSTFSITLPRMATMDDTRTAAARSPGAQPADAPVAPTLLLVSPSPDDYNLLAALLARRPSWRLQVITSDDQAIWPVADKILVAFDDEGDESLLSRLVANPAHAQTSVALLGHSQLPLPAASRAIKVLTRPLQIRHFLEWLDDQ